MKNSKLTALFLLIVLVLSGFSAMTSFADSESAAVSNPEYPLQGMLQELHLDMTVDEFGDLHPAENFYRNGEQTEWAIMNDELYTYLYNCRSSVIFTNLLCRLSGEFQNYRNLAYLIGDIITQEEEDKLYTVCRDFLNSFDWKNASDMQKLAHVAKLVCEAEYDFELNNEIDTVMYVGPYRHEFAPEGCLVYKDSVCDGYARSFLMLGRLVGLKVRYEGTALGGALHARNIVQIDGNWYEFDATYAHPTGHTDHSRSRADMVYLEGDLSLTPNIIGKDLTRRTDLYPIYFAPFQDDPILNNEKSKPGTPIDFSKITIWTGDD